MRAGIVRQVARLDIETLDVEAGVEQLFEHRGIIAELVGEVAGRKAGFEDRELHGARLATVIAFGQC